MQLVGALLGLGFVAALPYFGFLAPRLIATLQVVPALAERLTPTRLMR